MNGGRLDTEPSGQPAIQIPHVRSLRVLAAQSAEPQVSQPCGVEAPGL